MVVKYKSLNFIKTIDRLIGAISTVLATSASVSVIVWVLVFMVYIIGRALNLWNFMFVEEYTAYWLVFVVSFGMAYSMRSGNFVSVDVVVNALPRKARSVLAVVAQLLALAIIWYFMWRGVEWCQSAFASGRVSDFPSNTLIWPIYLLIPLGWASLSLEVLLQLFRSVIGFADTGVE